MLTAEDWQLYTDMLGCEIVARAMTDELNRLLKIAKYEIIENDKDQTLAAKEVRDEMLRFMEKYAKYGARDTEPEWALVDAINRALKTEIRR